MACRRQSWPDSGLGIQVRVFKGVPFSLATQGPSFEYFKRLFTKERLAINAHKMAPRTTRWFQERQGDTPTKGLAWERPLNLELSGTQVYEPCIPVRLGTTAHFCQVVFLKLRVDLLVIGAIGLYVKQKNSTKVIVVN